MSKKYVITFSNKTESGIESPEKIYNQSVIEYVTEILAAAAKQEGYDLDNCTAYPVCGMYKGSLKVRRRKSRRVCRNQCRIRHRGRDL